MYYHSDAIFSWFILDCFVNEVIEFDIDRDDSFTVKINIKDESPIYASVYNIHNGYYAHAIYYTDSSLKIDCFEKDYL